MCCREVLGKSRTPGSFEKKDQGGAKKTDNHQHPKLVYVRPEGRLLLQRPVHQTIGLIMRRCRTDLRRQRTLDFGELFVEHRVILAHLTHQKSPDAFGHFARPG